MMADKVASSGVSKEKGYLYYLGKDGNVWRSRMARGASKGGSAEKVATTNVSRESGFLYFIDKISIANSWLISVKFSIELSVTYFR